MTLVVLTSDTDAKGRVGRSQMRASPADATVRRVLVQHYESFIHWFYLFEWLWGWAVQGADYGSRLFEVGLNPIASIWFCWKAAISYQEAFWLQSLCVHARTHTHTLKRLNHSALLFIILIHFPWELFFYMFLMILFMLMPACLYI